MGSLALRKPCRARTRNRSELGDLRGADQVTRSESTHRRRHRRRRVRAHRRPRPERDPRRHRLRDRRPARRPRPHPRRPRRRRAALRIDSGFIVHNERTYPHLLRLFRELDVTTQPTEMSMSITLRGLRPVVCRRAGPARASSPSRGGSPTRASCRMLTEVPRFHRAARALLDHRRTAASLAADPTWGEFLARRRLLRATSSGTSPSRSSPASGPAGDATPSPTRPVTCSGSSITTGCSTRDAARRPGAPSPAARPPTSTARRAPAADVRRRAR